MHLYGGGDCLIPCTYTVAYFAYPNASPVKTPSSFDFQGGEIGGWLPLGFLGLPEHSRGLLGHLGEGGHPPWLVPPSGD